MTRMSAAGCAAIVVLLGAGYLNLQAARAQDARPSPATGGRTSAVAAGTSPQRALLDTYCVTCHNQRLKTAGLMLDTLDVDHVSVSPEIWEKVISKLRARAMPPARNPRPDNATSDAFAGWLETQLDRAALSSPDPGRPTVHRLNRVEYVNAVRDLLALDVNGDSLLPADETGYGFDNIADVLSLSPGLLERYMSAAWKISRMALGDSTTTATNEEYELSQLVVQEGWMGEDLPFGSRGGAALRHYFPADGEYIVRIRLLRTPNAQAIKGIGRREQLDVRLDGSRVSTFTVGGFEGDRRALAEYQQTADKNLEVRFTAKAGMRVLGISFRGRGVAFEGLGPQRMPSGTQGYSKDQDADMSVTRVYVEGPFDARTPEDTPSRRRILVCRPKAEQDEEPCAKTILSTLARRAYRRPVTDADVWTLLQFYRQGRKDASFNAGLRFATERLLVSPMFLFRVERDARTGPGKASRISDLELASRLSFFLWSSIPDDDLLDAAARGTLGNPAVLERQVRRMIHDPRASSLIGNFASQWLELRKLRTSIPDPQTFPEFDGNLREAFLRETSLFLESQLEEDHSVIDLLTANYTFLNERLARHYSIPNVYGNHFRRVTLTGDQRAGLLGQGSILMATSYPTRTSPVLRGKWLLQNFLGTPPPPPPPNVPALKEDAKSETPTSVRSRLEQHRRNPVCASCHSQMDPLGFALENFDAVGKWRTTATDASDDPVDASGVMPDGTRFAGPAEFRAVLLSRQQQFVTTFTERLLTYALGRGVSYADRPAIRQLLRAAAPGNYSWSSIIVGIAKSPSFQMRRSES